MFNLHTIRSWNNKKVKITLLYPNTIGNKGYVEGYIGTEDNGGLIPIASLDGRNLLISVLSVAAIESYTE